jgi:hypothetical protein
MPTLWPAGPWRFEAAVTITECNEQSVTNWFQFAQIADSGRLTVVLGEYVGHVQNNQLWMAEDAPNGGCAPGLTSWPAISVATGLLRSALQARH